MEANKALSSALQQNLLDTLQSRFMKNPHRHPEILWPKVLQRLTAQPEKLWSVFQMEESGGQPDVIGQNSETGEYTFCDCSPETPAGRRNLCYDAEAKARRKQNKPQGSALEMAGSMGISLLTQQEYRLLQSFGAFDVKTSSWVKTPDSIRRLGGALFCDRRYDTVFVYHNGAESYYSSRGFRGLISV